MWENFIKDKVPESEWERNFQMSRKRFYEFCDMLRPYLEKKRTRITTPIFAKAQVGSFLYYIRDEGHFLKNHEGFRNI